MEIRANLEIESLTDFGCQVLDNINSYILAVDKNGKITACNSAIRNLAEQEPLIGKTFSKFTLGLIGGWTEDDLLSVMKTGKSYQAEYVSCQDRAKKRYLMNIKIIPYDDQANNLQGAILIMDDVTDQRVLEQKLERLEKTASIGRLSANLAHELGNPLDGVLRYLKLLLNEMPKDDLRRLYAEHAQAGIMRVTGMIRMLLDFARKDSSVSYPIEIPKCISHTISIFRDQIQTQGIELKINSDENIPVVLNADLEHAFMNLIKNAIQAMPEGGILSVNTEMPSAKLLRISFSDTGSGIPENIREKIFEPFFTTKGFGKGVGLGLSISREIVEKYGGAIEIESEINKGTNLTLSLPIGDGGLTICHLDPDIAVNQQ